MKEIIGRKMGMTQVYTEDGTMYAVTVIEVLPNVVTQKKTKDHDGYDAIQIGYEDKKEKSLNKCEKGIFKKANVATKEFLFELKGDEMNGFEVGQEIKADLFKDGEIIDVIGTSKGRGYAGVIKRWGYKIGPKGHTDNKVHSLTMVDAITVLSQVRRCPDTWEINQQQF